MRKDKAVNKNNEQIAGRNKFMYNFSSRAKESSGDSVPDVKMMDLTRNWANSSIAIPGLKHHQLSVLDTLPTKIKGFSLSKKFVNNNDNNMQMFSLEILL